MLNSLVIPDLLAQGIVPGADIAENLNLENLPQGLNLENLFVYTPLKQQLISHLLMIYTGYIGQYFQLTSLGWYLFWGAVSTVFFVYLLYLVGNLIFRNREGLPRPAYKTMGVVFWLILISWTLYPLAYGVPLVWRFYSDWGSWAAVMRQFLYTVADISSKVIYGILITTIAQIRSAEEGYEPATRVLIGRRNSSVQETPDYVERR